MFIKPAQRRDRGWTLMEMMISVGIFAIGMAALLTIFTFCLKGFAAASNYGILDIENRQAMDNLTREIRAAQNVTSLSTNPPTLTLVNVADTTVVYAFDPTAQTMTRTANGAQSVLLTNCSLINFMLFQRNASNAAPGIYPAVGSTWTNPIKAIELTWKTSRAIGGTARVNTENVQTARIVIRN